MSVPAVRNNEVESCLPTTCVVEHSESEKVTVSSSNVGAPSVDVMVSAQDTVQAPVEKTEAKPGIISRVFTAVRNAFCGFMSHIPFIGKYFKNEAPQVEEPVANTEAPVENPGVSEPAVGAEDPTIAARREEQAKAYEFILTLQMLQHPAAAFDKISADMTKEESVLGKLNIAKVVIAAEVVDPKIITKVLVQGLSEELLNELKGEIYAANGNSDTLECGEHAPIGEWAVANAPTHKIVRDALDKLIEKKVEAAKLAAAELEAQAKAEAEKAPVEETSAAEPAPVTTEPAVVDAPAAAVTTTTEAVDTSSVAKEAVAV